MNAKEELHTYLAQKENAINIFNTQIDYQPKVF